MPFWNKNALPPELRDLPAEKISEMLAKAEADSKEVERLKADNDNRIKEMAGLNAKVTDLETKLKTTPPPRKDEDDDPPPSTPGSPSLTDWLTNPQEAFNRSAAPLTAATLATGSMTARMAAAEFVVNQDPMNRRLWKRFEKEVQELVDKLPAEQRIFPQTWINQFTFVKGIKLQDIVKEAQTQGESFFSEASTMGGSGIAPPGEVTTTLSPQEEKVAKSMKMDPKKYLERKIALIKQQKFNG